MVARSEFWFLSLALGALALVPCSSATAQWHYRPGFDGLFQLRGPDGDPAVTGQLARVPDSLGNYLTWGVLPGEIYSTTNFRFWRPDWPSRGSKELSNARIVAGSYNTDPGSSLYNSYNALTDIGHVYHFGAGDNYLIPDEWSHLPFSLSYEYGVKIKGAINYYGMSSQSVYVTRDQGVSWQTDAGGLGTALPLDLSIDSRHYVWLASTGGLYNQHPDSLTWKLVSSFPESFVYSVYNDRYHRTFASSFFNFYYSTDYGSSWAINNNGFPSEAFYGMTDDAYGYLYAWTGGVTSPTKLYRSLGGMSAWIRIDSPITTRSIDPSLLKIINDVRGDTDLIAATAFGFFISTNQGYSWCEDDCGIPSVNMFGFEQLSSGRRFISTSLGIYYRGQIDTSWTRSYPLTGYLGGVHAVQGQSGESLHAGHQDGPSELFQHPLHVEEHGFRAQLEKG